MRQRGIGIWRVLMVLGGMVIWGAEAVAAAAAEPFGFAAVVEKARALASRPYQPPDPDGLPPALAELDYQAYRDIRFRKARAVWANQPSAFSVELFHPGFLYRDPATIHEVVDGRVRTIEFDPAYFDYGANEPPSVGDEKLGFAGFRLHYPLHDAAYADEVIAFLGASYFRMVGRQQQYGLSARGLAVDTALPSGEEFPRFTEFWLVRPAARADAVEFFALLDSDSVAGAYAFTLRPGRETELRVRSRVFARKDIRRLGIAPLTSMFAWGENSVARSDDYRPEVHDSDGLLHRTAAGEWIWRPLVNPPALQESTLVDRRPVGFGLAQRDRQFDSYEDAEARYERRPGIWVRAGEGDWGEGGVHLVEIPTPDETNDNIVAFWLDREPFRAGQSRRYDYSLTTFRDPQPGGANVATVSDSLSGWGWVPGSRQRPPRSVRQFVIDFAGGELVGLGGGQPLQAKLDVNNGEASDVTVSRLPDGDSWRVAFKLQPAQLDRVVNMRLFLELRDRRVSETWNYVWNPASAVGS